MTNTKRLSQVRPNEKIKIVDVELLSRMPRLKDREFICSIVKRSGSRLFFQYFSTDKGSGTLKLISDAMVEVVSVESTLTLSSLLLQHRYENDDKRPKNIMINTNGRLDTYEIDASRFWSQTPTNIRLKGLKQYGCSYSVPGSSLVKEILS